MGCALSSRQSAIVSVSYTKKSEKYTNDLCLGNYSANVCSMATSTSKGSDSNCERKDASNGFPPYPITKEAEFAKNTFVLSDEEIDKKTTGCKVKNPFSSHGKRRSFVNIDSVFETVTGPFKNNARKQQKSTMDPTAFTFLQLLAMNALDLTVPASDAALRNRKNGWVQLAGHQGSFAPAGPHTIWKKRLAKDNAEVRAYQQLNDDIMVDMIPKFYREVEYKGEFFIEIEDLLHHFIDPSVMDLKMGTRTFLESEVKNPVLRKDLYEKMIALDPNEPVPEEHEAKAITKLRYMQFREKSSSTLNLGFRIEGIKMSGESPVKDLKKVKTQEQIENNIRMFIRTAEVQQQILQQLNVLRTNFESSNFFKHHEIIGSSILIMYDSTRVGVWMIDFVKTLYVGDGSMLNHRVPWVPGNHEDGYLFGLDNLINVIKRIKLEEAIDDC